jgi:hypothetical protein
MKREARGSSLGLPSRRISRFLISNSMMEAVVSVPPPFC